MVEIDWKVAEDNELCCIREDGKTCGQLKAENHHIIHGDKFNKRFSEDYGFHIPICRKHHERVHHVGGELDRQLKEIAQTEFERNHSRELWLGVVGRNYI